MSDEALQALADEAGVAPHWRDAFGQMQAVAPQSLRLVLSALGIASTNATEVHDSLLALRALSAQPRLMPLTTATLGAPVRVAVGSGRWRLTLEDGGVIEGVADAGVPTLPPIAEIGYHRLECAAGNGIVAVAPDRCYDVGDAAAASGRSDGRLWGLAVQLYALRRAGDGGIGDFAALAAFVRAAAGKGADAVAISPIHAQFSADLDRFSPYSPSSRVALNVLHADVDALLAGDPDPLESAFEAMPLVDWPGAGRARLARFRRAYARFCGNPPSALATAFAVFRLEQGPTLLSHATFEALHGHFYGRDPSLWNWRSWPEPYRDPANPAVAAFAREHAAEVDFHAFLQFLADRGLAGAQAAARDAGMKIGLIADLAVGTDGGGSHAWSRQGETLIGLSVGAPPDILSTHGQDWGLAAFSPTGLVRHGFTAYLEMLRAALRHAGGVRIDHVMGLARLWVLPEGARASEGAYLRFPLDDLLRLIALESRRHKAVILGEDLGTVPEGFDTQLTAKALMGLRVLWFEMNGTDFRPPEQWTREAAAMTSTHDLATVAGWWQGSDLDLRRDLAMLGDATGVYHAYENRARERHQLWSAMRQSGATDADRPEPTQTAPVVDAAIRHVAMASCDLALIPVEDVLGTEHQPNLPGTLSEHPNWRRRLAFDADSFFEDPAVSARLRLIDEARKI